MKISRDWLQNYFETPLVPADKIAEALMFRAFEIESVEKVGKDDVIDVKVTPNRGHDALSHRTIAKEVSACLSLPMMGDPLRETISLAPSTDKVSIDIQDKDLCPRYIAAVIMGVKVGPSPEWLVQKLEAIGQRSINNVVDATNFVMFDVGQPLHAFDAGKLQEKKGRYAIEVRKAKDGEKMLALDEKEYAFKDTNLLIVDANAGEAVGIAGVKGGKPAGITESTNRIIIESANFNGVSVRRTARALNLATDASQRFQQVISPEMAAHGMRRVVDLILKLAGGELAGFADEYPKKQKRRSVSFTTAHTSKLLGVSVADNDLQAALARLGLPFVEKKGTYTVEIPFERLDLAIPEDLIEEVGRIIGYEKIEAKELPKFDKTPEINLTFAASERVRENLIWNGYSEVYTSIFAEKGEKAVLNKVDGARPYLRANLVDGLGEALKRNVQNKDLLGVKEIKLFEIGSIWKESGEVIMVGTISETEEAQEKPLTEYAYESAQYDNAPVSTLERYRSFSRYPSITRDIALWVPAGTTSEDVQRTIEQSAGNLAVRIGLFDEFKKGEKTSYAFRVVFQSSEKTLTDDEANARMDEVYTAVKSKGWEVR